MITLPDIPALYVGRISKEYRWVVRKRKKEEAERRRREQQRIFVEGLQRYKSKGIQILIDGRECRPEEYRKLCEFREDGSFYMADYVGAETGVLTEIHFDRVYNR